jgi:hypothetical protein
MASIESAIIALILATPALTALIGAAPNHRIAPMFNEQDTGYPNIAYSCSDEQSEHTLDGGAGYHQASFTFECWDLSFSGVVTLSKTLRDSLKNYRGTSDGINIQHIKYAGKLDLLEEFPRDPPLFRRNVFFEVTYQE